VHFAAWSTFAVIDYNNMKQQVAIYLQYEWMPHQSTKYRHFNITVTWIYIICYMWTSTQRFHYHTAVIRPVLEYCAPVWHYALTKSHTLQLEAIQKRAIQIVLNFFRGMLYSSMLIAADLNSLASRREDISRTFFHNIIQSTSCLHHLLPDPKLPSHNSRLRSYEKFPRSHTRTKRYRSFVQYALSHYQDRIYNS